MIVMRTNVIMNALLIPGIDYGTPATSVIRAAASDLPVKAVAVLTGRPDYFLAARKEFRSLKDLKGKAAVDQAQAELKIRGPIPLDEVRDWSFAKKATKK